MPVRKMEPTEANKGRASVFSAEKLKLQKDEKARCILIDQAAIAADTHFLSGLGYYTCLGRSEVLRAEGLDVENCVFCRVSQSSDKVGTMRTRYVQHIMRYHTKISGEIVVPVSVVLLLFVFGDDKWNKIIQLRSTWGDLRTRDFMFGPCLSQDYQRFDMQPLNEALWLKDANLKAIVVQTYKEDKFNDNDLQALLSRTVDAATAEALVGKLVGIAPTVVPPVAGDVDNLLSGGDVTKPAVQPQSQGLDNLLGTPAQAPSQVIPTRVAQPQVAPLQVAPATSGKTVDFDDLMKL